MEEGLEVDFTTNEEHKKARKKMKNEKVPQKNVNF